MLLMVSLFAMCNDDDHCNHGRDHGRWRSIVPGAPDSQNNGNESEGAENGDEDPACQLQTIFPNAILIPGDSWQAQTCKPSNSWMIYTLDLHLPPPQIHPELFSACPSGPA